MQQNITEEFVKVESVFVRHRNTLMIKGCFTSIYTDYYLHLMQHALRYPEELDSNLKDAMADRIAEYLDHNDRRRKPKLRH